jgi:hypothetical protein
MNRFRRVLIRWEKKVENYFGMLHFVCTWITYRSCGLRIRHADRTVLVRRIPRSPCRRKQPGRRSITLGRNIFAVSIRFPHGGKAVTCEPPTTLDR